MLKILLSAAVAAALVTLPVTLRAQDYSDPAQSGKSTSKSKAATEKKSKKSATTTESTTPADEGKKKTTRAKREPTKGQLEARERQKKCGEEWREAKAKGTLEKGATWPKYWSACNTRLKKAGA